MITVMFLITGIYMMLKMQPKQACRYMYRPTGWEIEGAQAVLWINAFKDDGTRVAYPIIKVVQDVNDSAASKVQFYDDTLDLGNGIGDYATYDFPADVKLDSWMTMGVELHDGNISFSLTR